MPSSPDLRRSSRVFTLVVPAAVLALAVAPHASVNAASSVSPASASTSQGIDALWEQHSSEPDVAWRDPTSHARVVNVTAGFTNAGLPYFHQNVFTEKADLMLLSGRREKDDGYYTLNLRTGEVRHLSAQTGGNLVVLPRRRAAAFRRGDDVFLLNLDSGESRKLVTVPHDMLAEAAGFGFTADESKLLFAYCDELAATHARVVATTPPPKDIHVRRVNFQRRV